jgi:hypothetical protein
MVRGTFFASTVALTGALLLAAAGPAAADTRLSVGPARIATPGDPASPLNVEITYACEPGQANQLEVMAENGNLDGEVRRGWADVVCDGEPGTTTVSVESFAIRDGGGDYTVGGVLVPEDAYRKGQKIELTVELIKFAPDENEVVDSVMRYAIVQ